MQALQILLQHQILAASISDTINTVMAEAKSGAGGGRICNASEACMDQLEAASFSPNLSPMQKEAVEDCLGRFKLWAGNLGALHKGLRYFPLLLNKQITPKFY